MHANKTKCGTKLFEICFAEGSTQYHMFPLRTLVTLRGGILHRRVLIAIQVIGGLNRDVVGPTHVATADCG